MSNNFETQKTTVSSCESDQNQGFVCVCGEKFTYFADLCHDICPCGEKFLVGGLPCHRQCVCGNPYNYWEQPCHRQCICGEKPEFKSKCCCGRKEYFDPTGQIIRAANCRRQQSARR
jgi:hypothetical protein